MLQDHTLKVRKTCDTCDTFKKMSYISLSVLLYSCPDKCDTKYYSKKYWEKYVLISWKTCDICDVSRLRLLNTDYDLSNGLIWPMDISSVLEVNTILSCIVSWSFCWLFSLKTTFTFFDFLQLWLIFCRNGNISGNCSSFAELVPSQPGHCIL